jgi:hypothetical protein
MKRSLLAAAALALLIPAAHAQSSSVVNVSINER